MIPSDVARVTSQVAQPRATELKKKYCKNFVATSSVNNKSKDLSFITIFISL